MDSNGLVLMVARVPDLVTPGTYVVLIEDHSYENRKPKFPGGRIKVGESPIEGGVRELYEETGLETKFGASLRLLGKTTACKYDRQRQYPIYFVTIDFPSTYVERSLSGRYREGKLISYLARVPFRGDGGTFLPSHKTWLREANEEAYTDLFVP